MSVSQVQIPIVATDEFSEVFDSAQTSLIEFSNSVQGLSDSQDTLTSSSNELVSSDQNVISTMSDMQSRVTQLQNSTEELNETNAQSKVGFTESMTSVMSVTAAIGMSAQSVVGLGDAFMQNQDATLKLTNAHDNLTKAESTLAQDQTNLADAQEKLAALQSSGTATAAALQTAQDNVGKAQTTLANQTLAVTNAQDNLTAAQNRAKMASSSLDMELLQTATTTVPMLLSQMPEIIGFLTGWGSEEDALTISQVAQAGATGIASSATAVFDAVMDANPIVLVVLAVVALVAILYEATDGFKKFGPIINDLKDAWNDLKIVGEAVGSGFEALYNDVFSPMFEGLKIVATDVIGVVIDYFKSMYSSWQEVGSGIEALYNEAIAPIFNGLKTLAQDVIGFVIDYFKSILTTWEDVGAGLKDIWNDLSGVAKDVFGGITGFVKDAFNEVISLANEFIGGIDDIIKGIDTIASTLHLPTLAQIPKIPTLAEGGIVDQPTLAVLGEAGPEAVVPLGNFASSSQSLPAISNTNNTNSMIKQTNYFTIQQENTISSNLDVNSLTQNLANQIAQKLVLGY